MTLCNVLKCPNAANETVEPLVIAGPLCDEHRARLVAGEDYELQGTEESVTGQSQPTVLLDDALQSLDQYVLRLPPNKMVDGNSRGHLVPLRVQLRGEPDEREINLVIPHEMLGEFAAFFSHVAGLGG